MEWVKMLQEAWRARHTLLGGLLTTLEISALVIVVGTIAGVLIGLGLCATTGNIYAGLYYPIGVAAMTFIVGMIFLRETHGTLIWGEGGKPA